MLQKKDKKKTERYNNLYYNRIKNILTFQIPNQSADTTFKYANWSFKMRDIDENKSKTKNPITSFGAH